MAKLRLVDLEALLWASGIAQWQQPLQLHSRSLCPASFLVLPSVDASFPVAGETSHKPPCPQSINSRKIEKKATEYLSAFFSFLSLNFVHTATTKKKFYSQLHASPTTNAISNTNPNLVVTLVSGPLARFNSVVLNSRLSFEMSNSTATEAEWQANYQNSDQVSECN